MTLRAVPRGWRIVLICSLALNLAVAGITLGAVFDPAGRRDQSFRTAGPAAPLLRALPKDHRRDLAERLSAAPPVRGDRRARFTTLLAALTADPFDPAAVQAALAAQRQAGDARLSRAEGALIDILSDMSPEDRAAYAGALADSIRRR